MGASKTLIFSDQDNMLADLAKALAHPARIKILKYLLQSKTCICGDLVDLVQLSQPTVSQHLKVLKDARLVQGTIEGTRSCYCLNKEGWKDMHKALMPFLQTEPKQESNNCC